MAPIKTTSAIPARGTSAIPARESTSKRMFVCRVVSERARRSRCSSASTSSQRDVATPPYCLDLHPIAQVQAPHHVYPHCEGRLSFEARPSSPLRVRPSGRELVLAPDFRPIERATRPGRCRRWGLRRCSPKDMPRRLRAPGSRRLSTSELKLFRLVALSCQPSDCRLTWPK